VKIKLIALDLDGTTLLNDHKSISERTKNVLIKAAKQNILVVPTSGRILTVLPQAVLSVPGIQYAITSNGSLAYQLKDKKVIYSNYIPKEKALQLLRLLPESSWIEVWSEGNIYIENRLINKKNEYPQNPFHLEVLKKIGVPVNGSLRDPELLPERIEKINLPTFPDAYCKTLQQKFYKDSRFSILQTQHGFEIMNAVSTKAQGLHGFCDWLKKNGTTLKKENIMAIGDSENDIEMLTECGIGIAMGNAPESVRKAADNTTDTNTKDGAALAIEKYALANTKVQ
jgi:Cof subfamily protein (haloacid dehalogenase superfamily)